MRRKNIRWTQEMVQYCIDKRREGWSTARLSRKFKVKVSAMRTLLLRAKNGTTWPSDPESVEGLDQPKPLKKATTSKKESAALAEIVIHSDLDKAQKIKILEALL